MRCTECSRPVAPVVAVDIDGTLGDYHGHFLKFASMYIGNDIEATYDGRIGFKDWFLRECKYEDEATWNQIKLAYRQGGMKRSMPLYEGANLMCREIRDAGAELWLTTTRPFLRLDNIDPDTRFWLERHEIEYDGLLYDENKYRRLAELVDKERVVAVLDDLPEMIDEAARAFHWTVPLLRRTKWNAGVVCESAVGRLDFARNLIIGRIREWEGINEGPGIYPN